VIDKAIILAAGMGTRIAGAGVGLPKPLLPLDDTGLTFLDWHARSLCAHGVKEIVIVGSPATHGAKVASTAPVRWVMNDHPGDRSGSGHSAHLAFESEPAILDGKSRVVLMDADVVYDPTLFAELAPSPRSKTLVCGRFRDTAEEVMVFADDQKKPRVHGKGLLGTPLVRGLSCLGEATGILLLEPGDHDAWRASASWCMKFLTSRTRSEHEDITQRLMIVSALDAVVFADDTRFMECDTPTEYDVVRREMVPRWLPHLPRGG
jgi:choline kinase